MVPGAKPPSVEALQEQLLAQGFARYKLPEKVVALDRLPRNALGKVQRFVLQERIASKPPA